MKTASGSNRVGRFAFIQIELALSLPYAPAGLFPSNLFLYCSHCVVSFEANYNLTIHNQLECKHFVNTRSQYHGL